MMLEGTQYFKTPDIMEYKKQGNEKEARDYLSKAQYNFEQFGWKLKDDEVLTATEMLDTHKMSEVLHNIGQYKKNNKVGS